MQLNGYYITNEISEDRLDRADTLAEAIRLAREWVRQAPAGEPVCIEHNGLTVRQLVLMPDGKIEEAEIR